MITLICGTNRPHNNTRAVVNAYDELLKKRGEATSVLLLEELPHDFAFVNPVFGGSSPALEELVREKIDPAAKLVIISPEYNGGFPGVLKAFIDAIPPAHFRGKKAALVGVSSGRAGNLRGMDQLTNVLNYLNVAVLPLKVPVSRVESLLEETKLTDEETRSVLARQADALIAF